MSRSSSATSCSTRCSPARGRRRRSRARTGWLGTVDPPVVEPGVGGELSEHLGYEPGQAPPGGAGNARNGKPGKTILTDQGPLRIRSPRDRKGTFEPQIVKKRQTRWVGFDDRVISLYARGMTVREIQGHLAEIYGTEVSPDLISKITDTVLGRRQGVAEPAVGARLPDRLPRRARGQDPRRAHRPKPGVLRRRWASPSTGSVTSLGLWFQQAEGAKFWLHVLTELKTRGVADILFVCVDGLTGFVDAIETVFPHRDGANMSRASCPLESALRVLQGPQTARLQTSGDLHRRRRRARRRRAPGVRRRSGITAIR